MNFAILTVGGNFGKDVLVKAPPSTLRCTKHFRPSLTTTTAIWASHFCALIGVVHVSSLSRKSFDTKTIH
eukprot:scaffold2823_cov234-Alexandrium_tamarense.AAC.3